MRKYFLLLLPLFCITPLSAQDTIFKKGGGLIPCKVAEVGEVVIFSQKGSDAGSKYLIAKSEIISIHYANGTRDDFDVANQTVQQEELFVKEEKPLKPLCRYAVYSELEKMLISETNVGFEYRFNRYMSLDLNIGHIHYNSLFDPWVFSPSQNDWPGTVYRGTSYRFGLKMFPSPKKRNYIAIKGLWKTMYYSGMKFLDMKSGYSLTTQRSESATVRGLEIEGGHEFNLAEGHILFELFYGIGFRVRERNYTTYSQTENGSFPVPAGMGTYPTGSYVLIQKYPTLELGFKMGFCFGKLKAE
ncbi:MAG TPA: hypothetical protein VGO45_05440 [Bacteroidia bacterium]|jgi:hypothetical protein|nr:hypothetical protein [Bacteroidia bacterium]